MSMAVTGWGSWPWDFGLSVSPISTEISSCLVMQSHVAKEAQHILSGGGGGLRRKEDVGYLEQLAVG